MKFSAMTLVVLSILFSKSLGDKVVDSSAKQADRFASARAEAKSVTVEVNGKKVEVQPKPLYTYDEKVRNWNKGTTWVWGNGGRPFVALNLSTYKTARYIEFTSFSNEKILVTSSQGDSWTPKPNWKPSPIADGPKPAETKRTRLIQMRALAKKFSATQFEPGGDSYPLRLLSQPIYRYEKESEESLDGALFAFVRESDLEIILVVEAMKNEAGVSEFVFACRQVAANKQEVVYGNKPVWAHERDELMGKDKQYRLIFERVKNDE